MARFLSNFAVFILFFGFGQSIPSFGAKPSGYCINRLSAGTMEAVPNLNGGVHWVPADSWTKSRIGIGLKALAAANVPLLTTYLRNAIDPQADTLLKQALEKEDVSMARLSGGIQYQYRSLGAAALDHGLVFQNLLLPNGTMATKQQVLDVLRLTKRRFGVPKSADLLKNKVPGFEAISAEVLGVPIAAPFFWALVRTSGYTLSSALKAIGGNELSRQQALELGISLFEAGANFRVHYPISTRQNHKVMECASGLGFTANRNDLVSAANRHFGSWKDYLHAVRSARLNSVEIGMFAERRRVERLPPTSLHDEGVVSSEQVWHRLDEGLQQFEERKQRAASLLIDHIVASPDVLTTSEIREFLNAKSEVPLSDSDAEEVLEQLRGMLSVSLH